MKVSIITVTYNAEEFLEQCICSILSQTYTNIELIVVDGGSTDSTLTILAKYRQRIAVLISEKDEGIYDAMNKGIAVASGEVIGMLNADDYYAYDNAVKDLVAAFDNPDCEIAYGNICYVKKNDTNHVLRKWVSKPFNRTSMKWGWMPAHPTFYARKTLFETYGKYNLNFYSAADYELMLRFLYLKKIKSIWVDKILVIMRAGGVSNRTVKNRLTASYNDYKAMKSNQVEFPALKIFVKPLRKLGQYFN